MRPRGCRRRGREFRRVAASRFRWRLLAKHGRTRSLRQVAVLAAARVAADPLRDHFARHRQDRVREVALAARTPCADITAGPWSPENRHRGRDPTRSDAPKRNARTSLPFQPVHGENAPDDRIATCWMPFGAATSRFSTPGRAMAIRRRGASIASSSAAASASNGMPRGSRSHSRRTLGGLRRRPRCRAAERVCLVCGDV